MVGKDFPTLQGLALPSPNPPMTVRREMKCLDRRFVAVSFLADK